MLDNDRVGERNDAESLRIELNDTKNFYQFDDGWFY